MSVQTLRRSFCWPREHNAVVRTVLGNVEIRARDAAPAQPERAA